MKTILIIGTRGIPGSYSGFETSVEETATRFAARGHDVTVYCRAHHYQKKVSSYKGVKLVYLRSINTKHLDTLTHTLNSVLHGLFVRPDVVILYGVGNGIFLPFYRMLGVPTISVVDGADWERQKWGSIAKAFLKANSFFAACFSNHYVVDNQLLAGQYAQRFKRAPVYIPYGVKVGVSDNPEPLKKYGLNPHEYFIFVGRFVREKGVDFLVSCFQEIRTDMKLVVIGGNKSDPEYEAYIKKTSDDRILFPGFVYGEEYESLLSHAFAYVSCSYLEGTSPSLLMALAATGYALVGDLPENLETLKGMCKTFRTGDKEDFILQMNRLLANKTEVDCARTDVIKTIRSHYDWDRITDQYLELMD